MCVGGGRGRGRDVSLEYLTMGFIFTALPHSKNEIFLLHCGQGGGGVRQLQGWMANHLLIRPWVFHLDSASSLNLIQSLLSSVFVGFRNAICPSNPRVNHRLLPPPPLPVHPLTIPLFYVISLHRGSSQGFFHGFFQGFFQGFFRNSMRNGA